MQKPCQVFKKILLKFHQTFIWHAVLESDTGFYYLVVTCQKDLTIVRSIMIIDIVKNKKNYSSAEQSSSSSKSLSGSKLSIISVAKESATSASITIELTSS